LRSIASGRSSTGDRARGGNGGSTGLARPTRHASQPRRKRVGRCTGLGEAWHTLVAVERAIIGYHQDDEGDWVAELSCGHGQHVRHRPPFQLRAWVTDDAGRKARLGTLLGCPLCDRAEAPDGLRLVRSSPEWDRQSMPAGLGRAHRLGAGTWGRIVVHEGRLRFAMSSEPPLEVELGPGATQAIPPELVHEVRPLGPVRFRVEFLAVATPGHLGASGVDSDHHTRSDEPAAPPPPHAAPDQGGEAACWLHLVCPECGAMADGGPHREGCHSEVHG
jgi:tellurite resistance-related uncharacterized protein